MAGPRVFAVSAAVVALLAGCSLPRGAAVQREILQAESSEAPGFAVYPVTRDFLPQVANWPGSGGFTARKWPRHSEGASGQIIAAGDMVGVTVWDSDQNSLLAPIEQKSTQMQPMLVTPAGTIFVPYVGPVKISGMSPDHARQVVQDKLSGLMPSAQVQLNVQPGRKNSVDLVGGVGAPGTYPLVTRDMTVLSLLSEGRGVAPGLQNPQVRLVRGKDYYAISLERLYADPGLDATLRGGDKVFVESDPRYFLTLGATRAESQVPFTRETLTALDAVALAGGINDIRADPKGVLILREYTPAAVTPDPAMGPGDTRVVFTLDLTTADGLFSAGQFRIQPRDLVLATESPITSTRTILGLIGSVVGVANTTQNLGN